MRAVKKQKTYNFHNEWELEFFFSIINEKYCCLICNSNVSIPKKGNLKRDYQTSHGIFDTEFKKKF